VVDRGLVTIDPLPQWRVIDRADGTSVGYLELATFISTAEAKFDPVFAAFAAASVTDVIIDLRYNGGGLVSTTELLGDYLGGSTANNLVFSKTLFNSNNAVANRTRFFQQLVNSTSTSRLVVVASDRTASASELITNSMKPHVEVSVVGGTTFGKPVGQLGIPFCEKILRPTAFESVNANDEGGYYDGIPVDCPAADDLSVPIGDDLDPNLVVALAFLENGACPPLVSTEPALNKTSATPDRRIRPSRGAPWREYADAW
jgi:carboxyl-terminal processing protease